MTPRTEALRRMAPLAVLLAAACAGPRPAPRAPAIVGRTVEVSAADLAGREVRLPAEGARLTVVDFWATWCEPCREQLPSLERLAARYGARGLAVYAVSIDEERGAVEAFVAEVPVSFPVIWDRAGVTLAGPLEVTRLPTTVILDSEGVVRAVHLGFDARAEAALESEVRRLLGD